MTFTVVSNKRITTTVPDGATAGPITVTTRGGSASSSHAFTVTLPATVTPATVSVNPTVGPPASNVSVSGGGFGGQEAVDIYFDTTDEALASTDSTGSFSGISI